MTRSTPAAEADDSPLTDQKPTIQARALSTADAAHYICFSESFLRKARIGLTNTPGPKFKKIGKKVVYLRENLDSWLDQGEAAEQ